MGQYSPRVFRVSNPRCRSRANCERPGRNRISGPRDYRPLIRSDNSGPPKRSISVIEAEIRSTRIAQDASGRLRTMFDTSDFSPVKAVIHRRHRRRADCSTCRKLPLFRRRRCTSNGQEFRPSDRPVPACLSTLASTDAKQLRPTSGMQRRSSDRTVPISFLNSVIVPDNSQYACRLHRPDGMHRKVRVVVNRVRGNGTRPGDAAHYTRDN